MIAKELCRTFLESHPIDGTRSLESLGAAGAADVVGDLPREQAARLLGRMNPVVGSAVWSKLSKGARVEVLAQMEIHRSAALLRRVGEKSRDRVLAKVPEKVRSALSSLLSYPSNSAGAKLDPHYPCVPEDASVEDALDQLRASTDKNSFFLFTVNRSQELTGVVNVLDLLRSEAGLPVSDWKRQCRSRLSAQTEFDSVRDSPDLNRWNALPVTDEKGVYLGAVRKEALSRASRDHSGDTGAGTALGELFQIGLLGLAGSIEPSSGSESSRTPSES